MGSNDAGGGNELYAVFFRLAGSRRISAACSDGISANGTGDGTKGAFRANGRTDCVAAVSDRNEL